MTFYYYCTSRLFSHTSLSLIFVRLKFREFRAVKFRDFDESPFFKVNKFVNQLTGARYLKFDFCILFSKPKLSRKAKNSFPDSSCFRTSAEYQVVLIPFIKRFASQFTIRSRGWKESVILAEVLTQGAGNSNEIDCQGDRHSWKEWRHHEEAQAADNREINIGSKIPMANLKAVLRKCYRN